MSARAKQRRASEKEDEDHEEESREGEMKIEESSVEARVDGPNNEVNEPEPDSGVVVAR